MYYFNNKYIFAFIDSKQAKRSYNDRNLLKQYVDNKTDFKKIRENYLKEDEKKLQNNEYFVRINNGKNLIGKISKYFTPGEHDITGLIGSMVIHPDCEVELTFKKFKIINKKKSDSDTEFELEIEFDLGTDIFTPKKGTNVVNLSEILHVTKLILREQPEKFETKQKIEDEALITEKKMFARIFECNDMKFLSQRYLVSSPFENDSKFQMIGAIVLPPLSEIKLLDDQMISAIVLSPLTEIELLDTKNESFFYFNESENKTKTIPFKEPNIFTHLYFRLYINIPQPSFVNGASFSSIPFSNIVPTPQKSYGYSYEEEDDTLPVWFVNTKQNNKSKLNSKPTDKEDSNIDNTGIPDSLNTENSNIDDSGSNDIPGSSNIDDDDSSRVNDDDETKKENKHGSLIFYVCISLIVVIVLIVFIVKRQQLFNYLEQ